MVVLSGTTWPILRCASGASSVVFVVTMPPVWLRCTRLCSAISTNIMFARCIYLTIIDPTGARGLNTRPVGVGLGLGYPYWDLKRRGGTNALLSLGGGR